MQEKHLFEYAVIRVVPRVEREEFQNVGVILFCKAQSFLKVIFDLNEMKLNAVYKGLDLIDIKDRLHAFEHICGGEPQGGAIGRMAAAERFRWLTSTRSTIIQTSAVHPGMCVDAEATLLRLFNQLVL